MTALHWAAETGNAEIAQILVSAGAILEVTTRLGAYTPLHVAGRKGAAGVIRVLLDAGADPRTVAATGSTPLHLVSGRAALRGQGICWTPVPRSTRSRAMPGRHR